MKKPADVQEDIEYLARLTGLDAAIFRHEVISANPIMPATVGCSTLTFNSEIDITGFGNAGTVAVQGGFAYVGGIRGGNATLRIVNVANPNAMVLAGELVLVPNISLALENVVVDGTIAYCCYGDEGLSGLPRFYLIDVSNPAAPTLISTVLLNPFKLVYTLGINSGSTTLWVLHDDPAVNADRLQAYDVSNPALPVAQGSVVLSSSGKNLLIDGNFAYITTGDPSLQIVNISNPLLPVLVSTTAADPTFSFATIVKRGNTLYIGSEATATVYPVDVSNPVLPVFATPVEQPFGESLYMAVSDVCCCVYAGISGDRRIDVYTADNPLAPTFIASIALDADVEGLASAGSVLYSLNFLFGPMMLETNGLS